MTREEAAARVIEECFWGDYRFDVTSLLAHIDENSDYFDRFLIDRIVKNARHPSRLLEALYGAERTLAMIPPPDRDRFLDYHNRRRALVRANVSGDYSDPAIQRWVWKSTIEKHR
ncbi:MAG: hypothetical protein PF508_20685 [Spirochaeta sp.]|nr:hypothetical protein [Spirochaeta sp.]